MLEIFNILHIYNYQGERTKGERVLGQTSNRANGPGTSHLPYFFVPKMPTLVHFIPIFRPGPLK
jgi:hypothetical protein